MPSKIQQFESPARLDSNTASSHRLGHILLPFWFPIRIRGESGSVSGGRSGSVKIGFRDWLGGVLFRLAFGLGIFIDLEGGGFDDWKIKGRGAFLGRGWLRTSYGGRVG